MGLRYYKLVEVELDEKRPTFATAALWNCIMCNNMIDGMGGPGDGELCCQCAGDILAGLIKIVRPAKED